MTNAEEAREIYVTSQKEANASGRLANGLTVVSLVVFGMYMAGYLPEAKADAILYYGIGAAIASLISHGVGMLSVISNQLYLQLHK